VYTRDYIWPEGGIYWDSSLIIIGAAVLVGTDTFIASAGLEAPAKPLAATTFLGRARVLIISILALVGQVLYGLGFYNLFDLYMFDEFVWWNLTCVLGGLVLSLGTRTIYYNAGMDPVPEEDSALQPGSSYCRAKFSLTMRAMVGAVGAFVLWKGWEMLLDLSMDIDFEWWREVIYLVLGMAMLLATRTFNSSHGGDELDIVANDSLSPRASQSKDVMQLREAGGSYGTGTSTRGVEEVDDVQDIECTCLDKCKPLPTVVRSNSEGLLASQGERNGSGTNGHTNGSNGNGNGNGNAHLNNKVIANGGDDGSDRSKLLQGQGQGQGQGADDRPANSNSNSNSNGSSAAIAVTVADPTDLLKAQKDSLLPQQRLPPVRTNWRREIKNNVRATLSYFGVITFWTGVYNLQVYYFWFTFERDIMYTFVGLFMLWASDTLYSNALISPMAWGNAAQGAFQPALYGNHKEGELGTARRKSSAAAVAYAAQL
jgi:hypothetical protein